TLAGSSSNPTGATFAAADSDTSETPSSRVHPSIAVTVPIAAAHGDSASVTADVSAAKLDPGDPNVINPSGSTTATMIVLKPTTGQDEFGIPFQATAFIAVQAIPQQAGVNNEFLGTSLATFVFENLEGIVEDEFFNGVALLDPATDLSNGIVVDGLREDMPEFPEKFINVPAPAGTDDLVTTILNSAEVLSGADTYDDNFDELPPPDGAPSAVRAIDVPLHTLLTSGGTFVPTERIHYTNAAGRPGLEDSGLTNVTTTHGFELALIDTNVSVLGIIETGATDDFGLIVEAGETEPDSPVQTGEFIFLSLTGGKEGADVDTLDVPPHGQLANIIYVDLDQLDFELGVKTITRLFVIDGSGNGTVNLLEVFTLNVDQAACTSPAIFFQPTSQSACDGGSASFSVGATGTPPLQYQWRKGNTDLVNGGNISGATTATLTIDPVSPSDAADYSVTVANVCGGPIASATATLTVDTAPTITVQPVPQSVCVNDAAVFTVIADGTPSPTYQWRRNGVEIPGANAPTLVISPALPGNAGNYNVVVSNACGSIVSNTATLTVEAGPAITSHPNAQQVCDGTTAGFAVVAQGIGPLTYQWFVDALPISGETSSSLTIDPVGPTDAGTYHVDVTDDCGTVSSTGAALTVIDCGDCPPPAVEAEGARYIAVTPVAGPNPVAL
ncbi:MAG: immunoglobulin domain-containing protein, partial [Planctomycetes bacterium]|nr:immunoglobulin domain-containing protein [Planctomycetota bacterium]